MQRHVLLASAFLVWGCARTNSDQTPPPEAEVPAAPGASPFLATTTELGAGAQCPAGGVSINLGADRNGDGQLSSDEVTQTQVVCGGAPAIAALVRQRALPTGDSDCPAGGVRIEFGLDNGDGGATASDAILSDGEVDGGQSVCDAGRLTLSLPLLPPPALPSQPHFVIDTHGAAGSAGGNGGSVKIAISDGSLRGHVKVFNTGVADTSFTVPSVAPNYGDAPFEVPSSPNPFVLPQQTVDAASEGSFFFDTDTSRLSHKVGGLSVPVTGVHVPEGQTLQVPGLMLAMQLSQDIVIDGTLAPFVDSGTGHRNALTLSGAVISVGANGKVDMTGAVGSSGVGNGGALAINTFRGALTLRGVVDTSGAAGSTGGDAGSISIEVKQKVWSTGQLLAVGGGGVAMGGSGGAISLKSLDSACFVSGTLRSSAGSGARIRSAGNIAIVSGDSVAGEAVLGGLIEADDAAAACATVPCSVDAPSSEPKIRVTAYAGNIRSSAHLHARSADRATQHRSVLIEARSTKRASSGSITLSGEIRTHDLRDQGGAGGDVEITVDATGWANDQEIVLLGYETIDTHGGSGIGNGGNGGAVSIYQDNASLSGISMESGAAANYAHLVTSGGTGASGTGGVGGDVELRSGDFASFQFQNERVINRGTLTTNGGNGLSAGRAGSVLMYGYDGVDNSGAISANSGVSSNAAGTSGADVRLLADNGLVLNSATIVANGGQSLSGAGGGGAIVEVVGRVVHNTATGGMHCQGGAAGSTGAGGGGGSVYLTSNYGTTLNDAPLSLFSVSGGAGAPTGSVGYFILDGANATASIP